MMVHSGTGKEVKLMAMLETEEPMWQLNEQEIEIVREALYWHIGHLNGRFAYVEGSVRYAPYGLKEARQLARELKCKRIPIWSRKK